jgi:hypothetical protein
MQVPPLYKFGAIPLDESVRSKVVEGFGSYGCSKNRRRFVNICMLFVCLCMLRRSHALVVCACMHEYLFM